VTLTLFFRVVAGESVVAAELYAPLTFDEAIREVIRNSMVHNGLVRGLKEAVKALDRREAVLAIIADSCDEQAYVKLVTALCQEHGIPLVKIVDSKTLGEYSGLCRLDGEGNAVKVVSCSCAVLKTWGEESPARGRVLEEIQRQQ
jgi:small subunit ribosomal protein S12e